jgi:hypothetical protein
MATRSAARGRRADTAAADADGAPNVRRAGSLEITGDLTWQAIEWKVERVGWALMAAVLLAALAGLLGPGPFSAATAGTPGSALSVAYHRWERREAPVRLRVHLGPGAAVDGRARVWIDRAWIDGVVIDRIDPEPRAVEAGPDRMTFDFAVAGPTALTFHVEPRAAGLYDVRVGLAGGPSVAFRQRIHP